ncbi:MAG: MarR family transcriptional regulator [Caldilineaceae bacterium]|nr:MarR family transcriptional regulator [Caldilineaceae bacterium]
MGEDRREELTDRFRELAEYLNRQLHTARLDEWEDLGMTIPQIKTLVLLGPLGPLRMGNIAACLGRALSATTTIVDRLVEKGLVDRISDPNDRRVVICKLTDAGEETLKRFWRIGRERLDPAANLLDEEQLEIVVKGLELIHWAEDELQRTQASMQSTVEQDPPSD